MSRKGLWRIAQVVIFAIVGWYFVRTTAAQWNDVTTMAATLRPDWWGVGGSAAWVLLSYAVLIETWRQTVIAWGGRLSWGTAAHIWFVSNLGRYVPGKVWQVAAMGVLAQRAGVSSVAAIGSSLVVNLVNVLAACLVVSLAGARQLAGEGFAAAVVVFFAVVATSPWLIPRLVRFVNRVTARGIPEPRIPPLAIALAVAGCALAWNLYGIGFRELAVSLLGDAAGRTSSYTAVFTLSYISGYLAIFAPGGLGVREGVLTKLLAVTGLASGAGAVLLVIASRLWLTVLEAMPGLILLAVRRPLSPPLTTPNGP